MQRRHFNGANDLVQMQRMVAERTQVMGPCTNLHPGDIAHRIYSGSRRQNLDEVVPVYVDDMGITAFGIIWPQDAAFDMVTGVGMDTDGVTEIAADLADRTVRSASVDTPVETDVIGDDDGTIAVLTRLGFTENGADYMFTEADLGSLPAASSYGYTIRSATHGDSEQLAAVHSGAFGSGWSAANYEERMATPGYDPLREIVAVDDDGRFIGFAVTWYDDMNKVGYFEPVGVHRDFHRRGVGSALLAEGKTRMRRAGMAKATVWHSADEERAITFYRSNGFAAVNSVTTWSRDGSRSLRHIASAPSWNR